MSITWRLILSISLLVCVFWLTAAVISQRVYVDELDEIIAENLQGSAARILNTATHILLEAPRQEPSETENHPDDLVLLMGERSDYLAFEVRDGAGRLVLRSSGSEDLLSDSRARAGFYVTPDAFRYAMTDPVSNYSILVATASHHRDEAVAEARWALVLPMIGLLALTAGAITLLVRVFLSPLKSLSSDLASRGGNNLTPLPDTGLPPELLPIAGSVNLLMERLQKAMDAERVFAANSAHELRTPLAGALAQAQQLQSEIASGKGSERAAGIVDALKRLAHLSTRLLQLARADANLGQMQDRQNLRPVLKAVVDDFTNRASAPLRITVEDTLLQDLMVQMDPDAFAIILRNLIENAEKHGASGKPISIIVSDDWTISVKNHGAIVPAEDIPALKQRFQRGQSDSDGSGLGLSIADKLATQSGGSLTLISPAVGFEDGFQATIKLP